MNVRHGRGRLLDVTFHANSGLNHRGDPRILVQVAKWASPTSEGKDGEVGQSSPLVLAAGMLASLAWDCPDDHVKRVQVDLKGYPPALVIWHMPPGTAVEEMDH